jgi:hypothetical protein
MEFSLLVLIGISVAAMFFGYFFGLSEGRGQGYKKRQKEEASNPAVQMTLPPPSPPNAPPMPVVPAQAAGKSLLNLSLDARERPCLDLDGQPVDTTQMEPQQRKRLIDLIVLMRPWIEAGPVAKQAAPPAPAESPSRSKVRAAPAPRAPAAAAAALDLRSAAAIDTPAAPAVPAPTTMVGQIDSILQIRLVGTPYASRGVRLVESAEGGAMVVVGNDHYEGVAEVPDPEVQAIIRAAIAEWENRFTPGL